MGLIAWQSLLLGNLSQPFVASLTAAVAIAIAPDLVLWPPMKPAAWQKQQSCIFAAVESASPRSPRQDSGKLKRFVNSVPVSGNKCHYRWT